MDEKSPTPRTNNLGSVLKIDYVRNKARREIDQILKLNLFGNGWANVSCLAQCSNLEVVALTQNHVDTLEAFQNLVHMKELLCRENSIPASLQQIRYLSKLSQLRVVNFLDNPIVNLPGYRLLMIKTVPSLERLDDIVVTDKERELASRYSEEECAANDTSHHQVAQAGRQQQFVSTTFSVAEN